MKKYLILLLTLFALSSCEQDPEIIGVDAEKKAPKVDVCHYDATTDTWETLSINENALTAHLKHGDYEGSCENRQTYVPDDAFESLLMRMGLDLVLDNYVLTSNINNITNFQIPWGDNGVNYYDLTGIEDFSALEELEIGPNPIKILNLTKNTKLTQLTLTVWHWIILDLDLTKNINLEKLYLLGEFSSLDLTRNRKLYELEIFANLTELDLSKNIKLKSVWLDSPIKYLDLSQNRLLEVAYISDVFDINLTKNFNLTFLNLYRTSLKSLDLSRNTKLARLFIESNPELSALNLKSGTNRNLSRPPSLTQNPSLFCIQVDDPAYSTVSWTNVDPWTTFSEDCGY